MNVVKGKDGLYKARVYSHTDENGTRKYEWVTGETKKEVEFKAARYKVEKVGSSDQTVAAIIAAYIEDRKPFISATTYAGYKKIERCYITPDPIAKEVAHSLTDEKLQRFVNRILKDHSRKTAKSAKDLLHAAMKKYEPNTEVKAELPRAVQPQLYIPTIGEIQTVLAYAKEHDVQMYRAILLGAIGCMRRGEICALTADDVDIVRNTVFVQRAMVRTIDGEYKVNDYPKTDSSIRKVILPPWVISEMPVAGRLCDLNCDQVTMRFNRLLKCVKIHTFRFHDLRHFAVSFAHGLGCSDESCKALGGWTSSSFMKRTYVAGVGEQIDEQTQKRLEALEVFRGQSQCEKSVNPFSDNSDECNRA